MAKRRFQPWWELVWTRSGGSAASANRRWNPHPLLPEYAHYTVAPPLADHRKGDVPTRASDVLQVVSVQFRTQPGRRNWQRSLEVSKHGLRVLEPSHHERAAGPTKNAAVNIVASSVSQSDIHRVHARSGLTMKDGTDRVEQQGSRRPRPAALGDPPLRRLVRGVPVPELHRGDGLPATSRRDPHRFGVIGRLRHLRAPEQPPDARGWFACCVSQGLHPPHVRRAHVPTRQRGRALASSRCSSGSPRLPRQGLRP